MIHWDPLAWLVSVDVLVGGANRDMVALLDTHCVDWLHGAVIRPAHLRKQGDV